MLASAHTAVTSCTVGLCLCLFVKKSSASLEHLLTVLPPARRPCTEPVLEGNCDRENPELQICGAFTYKGLACLADESLPDPRSHLPPD